MIELKLQFNFQLETIWGVGTVKEKIHFLSRSAPYSNSPLTHMNTIVQ